MLERGDVLRVALARGECPLERGERLLVLARVEVLPAEVVQQRAEPVGGGLGGLGELDAPLRPGDEAVAIGRGERAHVRRVGGEPVLAGGARRLRTPPRRAAAPPPCRRSSGADGHARGSTRIARADPSRPPPRRAAGRLPRTGRAAPRRGPAASAPPPAARGNAPRRRRGRRSPSTGAVDPSAARRREVLVVAEARAPPPADRRERADEDAVRASPSPAGRGSGRRRRDPPAARRANRARTDSRRDSRRSPRRSACIDQRAVPSTKRQLKPEVLSAAIDASSFPRYADTGRTRRSGKRASHSRRKTATTSPATRRATTMRPVCARPVEVPVRDDDRAQLRRRDGTAGAVGVAQIVPAHGLDRRREARRRGRRGAPRRGQQRRLRPGRRASLQRTLDGARAGAAHLGRVALACPQNLANGLETPAAARQLITVEAASHAPRTPSSAPGADRAAAGFRPAVPSRRASAATGCPPTATRETGRRRPAPSGSARTMYGNAPNPGVRLRYRRLRCGDWWNEDPRSPTYNSFQHVALRNEAAVRRHDTGDVGAAARLSASWR